jgi:hypothetical protein
MSQLENLIPIVEIRNQDYRFKNLFFDAFVEPDYDDEVKEEFYLFNGNGFDRIPWDFREDIGYFASLWDEETKSYVTLPYKDWVYDFGRNRVINKKYDYEGSPYAFNIDETSIYILKKVESIEKSLSDIHKNISKFSIQDEEYLKSTIDSIYHRVNVFKRVLLNEPSNEIFCL